jgi:hypothetical protein
MRYFKLLVTAQIAFILLANSAAGEADAKPPPKNYCQNMEFNKDKNSLKLLYNNNWIHILGWYHGNTERETAILASEDIYKLAGAKKCAEAEKKTAETVKKLEKQVEESKRVFTELKAIYQEHPFKNLGTEYSNEMYRAMFYKGERNAALDLEPAYKKLCPDHQGKIADYFLLFPGVETEFVRLSKEKINLKHLDSQALIDSSLQGFNEEDRYLRRYEKEFNKSERSLYNKLSEIYLAGKLTEEIVSKETEALRPEMKMRFRKYFLLTIQINKNIKKRDEYMIDGLTSLNESAAMLVGNSHISGMQKLLEDRCGKSFSNK